MGKLNATTKGLADRAMSGLQSRERVRIERFLAAGNPALGFH